MQYKLFLTHDRMIRMKINDIWKNKRNTYLIK